LTPASDGAVIRASRVASAIHLVRGQKVILDEDLAALYGVETKRLNEQVRRNGRRFPHDFAFRLTTNEFDNLKSQIATSSSWGGRRKAPLAFTEHGVVAAAFVLNSRAAVSVSVQVVRAFIAFREQIAAQSDVIRRLGTLERRTDAQDTALRNLADAFRKTVEPAARPRKRIGFVSPDERARDRDSARRSLDRRRATRARR